MTIYPSDLKTTKELQVYDADLYVEKQASVRPKVTLTTVLISVFLLLALFKQTEMLDWSWWWVSLPLWLAPAFYGLLIVAVILISLGHELRRILRRRNLVS
ncbi:hypothetical protein GO755_08955 [Spirosoma sp. HMF4905]|uniref:Transmembrane protein n=1 Tax=Spirosoma arboris TaxID=2682092 RepID=A0A7K1S8S8_9BACT|nr:hypothetical protein [Spirosoma arboris]MVM30160.1 hypothetical protein [Spirosoma arboris]